MYVYDLPYGVKENLVALLDFDRTWMRLATTCLGYSHIDVAKFEQARYKNTGDTPAAAMISNYGMKNKTVGELYKALHQLGLYQVMMVIKDCVSPELQRLLQDRPPVVREAEVLSVGGVHPGAFPLGAASPYLPPPPPIPAPANLAPSSHRPPTFDPNREDDVVDKLKPKSFVTVDDDGLDQVSMSMNNVSLAAVNRSRPPPQPSSPGNDATCTGSTSSRPPATQYEVGETGVKERMYTPPMNGHRKEIEPAAAPQAVPYKQSNRGGAGVTTAFKANLDDGVSLADAAAKVPLNSALAPHLRQPALASSCSPLSSSPSQHSKLSERLRHDSSVPVAHSEMMIRNVEFDVLKSACRAFAPEGLLGKGGFGEVYKGRWNGQDIAVKRIIEGKRMASEDFQTCFKQAITELQAMHNYPAENILTLLAISFSENLDTDPCLVYQYMANGSLSDRLKCRNGTAPLTWEQRSNVARGTAKGLVHLHALEPPIIHGDIKSGNILLDRHFEPRIGDFGLARGGAKDETHRIVTTVKGTQAYLPEDYIRSKELAPAVDTFCYGILMFELVCGKSPSFKPIPEDPSQRIRDIMLEINTPGQWVDPNVPRSGWASILFYTGKDCALRNRRNRPPMEKVLAALEKLENSTSPLVLQWFYDAQQSNAEMDRQRRQMRGPGSAMPPHAGFAQVAPVMHPHPPHSHPHPHTAALPDDRNIPAFLNRPDGQPLSATSPHQSTATGQSSPSYSYSSSTQQSFSSYRDYNSESFDVSIVVEKSVDLIDLQANLPTLSRRVNDAMNCASETSAAIVAERERQAASSSSIGVPDLSALRELNKEST